MSKNEEQLLAEAELVQEGIRHHPVEHIILVLPDRTLRAQGVSDDLALIPDGWESEARLAEPGAILIHNHPLGGPPSPEDFDVAGEMMLLESRVVTGFDTWICREAAGWSWPQMAEAIRGDVADAEKIALTLALAKKIVGNANSGQLGRGINQLRGDRLLELLPHLVRVPTRGGLED